VQIDSKASSDSVNKALLDDLQTAAAKAGITVTITTASTGHNTKTSTGNDSRHGQKTAVDIALINGRGSEGATGPSNGNTQFRDLGNKLKDALVSMKYSLNSESGNNKAVLWQTPIGGNHFNHLHVSNTTDSSTDPSLNNTGSSTSGGATTATSATTNTDDYVYGNPELGKLLSSPMKGLGESLKESKIYGEFGKESKKSFGAIILPKEKNEKIKSPINGIVVRGRYNTSCVNQITIEHEVNKKTFYLQYCGISRPSVSTSSKVSVGTVLGKTDSDVEITLYDSSYTKINIDSLTNSPINNDKKRKFDSTPESYPNVFGKVVGNIIATPVKWFEDKYDENGKRIEKRWGSPTEKEQPTDWLNQLSPTYKKKVKEDIERIKKML
jgi:hypothetical protein